MLLDNLINSDFSSALVTINFVLSVIVPIVYLSQNIFSVISLFAKSRKYKTSEKLNKFAYLICAHDEEKVIGSLIESIKSQDYPKELIEIFVVCDNCTDNTKTISESYGARVIERNDDKYKGKCYALDYAFKLINKNYNDLNIDAFIIMDSDNLVSTNYTSKMNDCYNSGYKVATSYRNGKNFDSNWISACSSLTFLRECEVVHKGRSVLNIGTYVSGTGFYVSKDLIQEINGWPFTSLIEDIEFSIWCSNNNIKIGYQYDAVFYDEQPTRFKDSFNQRLRWCRGTHQCFVRHFKNFFKGIFKNKSPEALEMLIHVNPLPAIMFIWMVIYTILLGINAIIYDLSFAEFLNSGIIESFYYILGVYGVGLFHGLVAIVRGCKRIHCNKFKLFIYWLLFPLFMFIFLIISVISLFVRAKWKKVEHNDETKICDLES